MATAKTVNRLSDKLTKLQKQAAQMMAKKAGRPYPNLVDNMRAAQGKK